MVFRFIATALIVLNAQALFARELVVISDLDETLRIANVENHAKAGLRLLAGVKPYEGLTTIFQDIKLKNPDAKFYYLSNSYTFLYNGKKWTRDNGLPEGESFQRCLKDKMENFKPEKLREIAKNHPDATFLMFGDNIEKDPDFYKQFKEENQLHDSQIFIRDARLIFPQENGFTYFQTDSQIVDDLNVSPEAALKVNALTLSQMVPRFLFRNLRKRLIQECEAAAGNCTELADSRIQEVTELLSPAQ